MQPKTKAKLNYELMRINRVVDHAEANKSAWDFIEVRHAVMGLVQFVDGLLAEEVAQIFVEREMPDKKLVPVSERDGDLPV